MRAIFKLFSLLFLFVLTTQIACTGREGFNSNGQGFAGSPPKSIASYSNSKSLCTVKQGGIAAYTVECRVYVTDSTGRETLADSVEPSILFQWSISTVSNHFDVSKIGPCVVSENTLLYQCGLQVDSLPDSLSTFSVILKITNKETLEERSTLAEVALINRPHISSLFPSEAGNRAALPITIQGTGFLEGVAVRLGGKTCQVTALSTTFAQCISPITTDIGKVTVEVQNPAVTDPELSSAKLENGFEFLQSDKWKLSSASGMPRNLGQAGGVWTGSKAIFWGGYDNTVGAQNTGVLYDPVADSITQVNTAGAPAPRNSFVSAWTGSKMVIWGGSDLNSGGIYDPENNSWSTLPTNGAPSPRCTGQGVWIQNKLVVGGGLNYGGGYIVGDGASYSPETNQWTAVSTNNAPSLRASAVFISTGDRVFVWAGSQSAPSSANVNDGALYDPKTNTWETIDITGAPAPRSNTAAVFTGSKILIFGGDIALATRTSSGGIFDIATKKWQPMSNLNAPGPRANHKAIWTGSAMFVWGGHNGVPILNTGGLYNPSTDTWTATTTIDASAARSVPQMYWTGSKAIIGNGGGNSLPTFAPIAVYVP